LGESQALTNQHTNKIYKKQSENDCKRYTDLLLKFIMIVIIHRFILCEKEKVTP